MLHKQHNTLVRLVIIGFLLLSSPLLYPSLHLSITLSLSNQYPAMAFFLSYSTPLSFDLFLYIQHYYYISISCSLSIRSCPNISPLSLTLYPSPSLSLDNSRSNTTIPKRTGLDETLENTGPYGLNKRQELPRPRSLSLSLSDNLGVYILERVHSHSYFLSTSLIHHAISIYPV
jgi:hypothetical protein